MKHLSPGTGWLLAAALTIGGIGTAAAADGYTSQTTTRSEHSAGSAEGFRIQEWLRAKDAPFGPAPALRFAPGDRITVERTSTSVSDGMVAQGVHAPSLPLPASGQTGDTIAVTHAGGGWVQSWSYQWSGNSNSGAWGLSAYRIEKVRVGSTPD